MASVCMTRQESGRSVGRVSRVFVPEDDYSSTTRLSASFRRRDDDHSAE